MPSLLPILPLAGAPEDSLDREMREGRPAGGPNSRPASNTQRPPGSSGGEVFKALVHVKLLQQERGKMKGQGHQSAGCTSLLMHTCRS